MLTIYDIQPSLEDLENSSYSYQPDLTSKLDSIDTDFDQDIINEIVLWKVNRYAKIDSYTLKLINQIKKNDTHFDLELTCSILLHLLSKEQRGIRLAMTSTILRFKNANVYQIIDQRVYRFLFGKELKYSEKDINEQINIYLEYLQKLKAVCIEFNLDFKTSDRVLYSMDKIYNIDENLKGY